MSVGTRLRRWLIQRLVRPGEVFLGTGEYNFSEFTGFKYMQGAGVRTKVTNKVRRG